MFLFTPWTHEDRLTLLSSPEGQPDCEIWGHLDFTTEPEFTIRINVRELICCLALPQELTRRAGDKEIGFQNVFGCDSVPVGLLIDFYSSNLVLAFAARDIKVARNASAFTIKVTASSITFLGTIQSQLGLTMAYLPAPTPLEKQIALFMVQFLSVAADLIPVVGTLVGFAIYIGRNTIIDARLGLPV